ncbi:hypothetical protein ES702_02142 [subsurface metagenome]
MFLGLLTEDDRVDLDHDPSFFGLRNRGFNLFYMLFY